MPATPADLEIFQGDDEEWTVTVSAADGSPADLTGYTARAQIRRGVADADPEIVAEMATSIDSPYVMLSIPHTITATMNGRYRWDLELESPGNKVRTIMGGKVEVTAEVTRAAVTALRAVA